MMGNTRLLSVIALAGSVLACSESSDSAGDQDSGGKSGAPASGGKSAGSAGRGSTAEAGRASAGRDAGGATGSSSGGRAGQSNGSSAGRAGSSSSAGSAGAPTPIDPNVPAGSCGLENPAFCETFETKHPGGRAGDLDENVWSMARWGHQSRMFFVRNPATTVDDVVFPASFCGRPFEGLLPYDDVAICDGIGVDGRMSGQLNEVFDDQGDFGFNSIRVRQLFDFTGRTGTVVFDVDAKVNPYHQGHGWWIELFITEDPSPLPYHEAPGVQSFPRNGVGFAFQGFNSCEKSAELMYNALNRVIVTRNHEIVHDYAEADLEHDSNDDAVRCVKTQDMKPNRFKFMINKDSVEVFGSDYDDPTNLRRIARTDNLDLPFSRGYIHIQHAHYNARKDGNVTPVQTYSWDNVGFDGPTYPLPRAYEVQDNDGEDADDVGGRMYGYYLTDDSWTALSLPEVELAGATKASFGFTIHNFEFARTLEYRFNGGPVHEFTVPRFGSEGGVRGFAVDVPLDELVEGTNRLEVRMQDPDPSQHDVIANMDLTLEVPR